MSYSSGSATTQNEKRALFCMMGHHMLMANLMLVMRLIRSKKFLVFIVIVHFYLPSAVVCVVYNHLNALLANIEFWVPYSQRYLVLGYVGLVGLALWLALNKYHCEYGILNSMFATLS